MELTAAPAPSAPASEDTSRAKSTACAHGIAPPPCDQDSDRPRQSIRTTNRVSPVPVRATTGRARFRPDACSSWISAQTAVQGLRLGQGDLLLGRNGRIADQGYQNRPFAVSYCITKRPIVNLCKGAFCDPVLRNPLGFLRLSATRRSSLAVARAWQSRCVGAPRQNHRVKCKIIFFRTYKI